VRELYLVHMLESLEERSIRSAIVFCATCRGCHMLSLLLAELRVPSVALHSHLTQGRRLAALHRCAPLLGFVSGNGDCYLGVLDSYALPVKRRVPSVALHCHLIKAAARPCSTSAAFGAM
jgi:hypothetical protein